MDLVILDGGTERRVSVERVGSAFEVSIDGKRFVVDRAAVGERLRSLVVDGHQFEVSAQSDGDGRYRISALGDDTTVEVRDPLRHLAMGSGADEASDGKRAVTAYMPGRVVAVLVEEGHQVEVGQGVVVLEAMKMENEFKATTAGRVKEVRVQAGQTVNPGDVLVVIE